MKTYTNQYLDNTVLSASPEQLMLMLYDGAIRFISLGMQAIDSGLIDKRAYYINKTTAIVSEFAATLDHSQNTQLAEDLDALYAYMLKRMLEANLKNDTAPLMEVKKLLSDLRSTWAQAIDLNKKEMREASSPGMADESIATYRPLAAAM
jgi:flagellar protein FliS